jgi:hypothetical protein
MRAVSDESPAASPTRAVSLADDRDLLLAVTCARIRKNLDPKVGAVSLHA